MTLNELNDQIVNIPGVVRGFIPEVNSLRATALVIGKDGVERVVSITYLDILEHGPSYAFDVVVAAVNAGNKAPFCIHCGREY